MIPDACIASMQIFVGTVFAVCIGAVSWKAKSLSVSGAVATVFSSDDIWTWRMEAGGSNPLLFSDFKYAFENGKSALRNTQ